MSSLDRTERVVHILDSKDRTTGTNENFTITLTERLTRVQKAEVVSIEVPFSFYVITSTNNVLNFEDNVSASHQITIDEGNYSGVSLVSELTTKMDALYAGWSISYSNNTYKITFTHSTDFKLILAGSTLAPIIGLLSDSTVGTSFTCQGILCLMKMFIHWLMIKKQH